MIWLANGELMQSRVPPHLPHLLLSQSSLIYLSHVPLLLLRSLSLSAFSNLLFLYCGEQQNNSCTRSRWWDASSRPTGSVAVFTGISVNMVWSLLILLREATNGERRTCKHSSDRSEPTAAQTNICAGVWRFTFSRVYAIKHEKPAP